MNETASRNLLRPEQASGQVFREVVRGAIAERADLRDLNHKALAEVFAVSPSVIGMIYSGEFPGKSRYTEPVKVRKYNQGKIGSLVRVCDELKLDVQKCLALCGLEFGPDGGHGKTIEQTIERERRRRKESVHSIHGFFDKESLAKLVELEKGLSLMTNDELLLLGRLIIRFGRISESELKMLVEVSDHIPQIPEDLVTKMISESRTKR